MDDRRRSRRVVRRSGQHIARVPAIVCGQRFIAQQLRQRRRQQPRANVLEQAAARQLIEVAGF